MADIKTKYPSNSSIAVALGITSLASDSNLLAGRASTAVDNTTNLDLDHLVSGVITVGTSPTAGTQIEIWAYASYKTVAGAPTYPDSITGTDAAKTISSSAVKLTAIARVAIISIDGTSSRPYPFTPVSIAGLFGVIPKFWGLFVVHNTGVALNATGQDIQYERVQAQTV